MLPTKTKNKRKYISPEATSDQLKSVYKLLAKVSHSDINGGSDATMAEINANMDRFKQLANSKIHIGIVLDDSGSMRGKSAQAIKAYNTFLTSQSNRDQVTVSLATFHSMSQVLPLGIVSKLTRDLYRPHGTTPLYDTIADTIHNIDQELNSPNGVVVCIITDREECSSKEYRDPVKIRELIQGKLNLGWQFVYIQCGYYSSLDHATKIGIPGECYSHSTDLGAIMGCLSKQITSFRIGDIKQITFKGE